MVIQCEKCNTRFRLPDDRLKKQGVKVRCSHCKDVFTVYPPSEEPAAAAPAPAPEPEPTPPPAAGGDDDLDFESSFSEESNAGGDDFDLPEGDEGDAGESDDFGFDFDEGEGGEAGQAPNEFAFDEGAQDEFSLGDEGGAEEAGPSEFSFDDSTWDESSPEEKSPAAEEPPPADSGVGEGAKDEFSFDEEDWSESSESTESSDSGFGDFDSDFGIEDNSAQDLPSPASEQSGADFKFTELAPASSGGELSGGFGDGDNFGMGDDDLVSSVPEPPVRRQKKSSSTSLPLLVVLLVVLAGAAGFFLWQQGQLKFVDDLIAQIKGATSIPETSRIEVKSLDHDFAENQQAGSLFVIRGQAFNRFGVKRSSLQVRANSTMAMGVSSRARWSTAGIR